MLGLRRRGKQEGGLVNSCARGGSGGEGRGKVAGMTEQYAASSSSSLLTQQPTWLPSPILVPL
jgi:hypothetical protein